MFLMFGYLGASFFCNHAAWWPRSVEEPEPKAPFFGGDVALYSWIILHCF